MAKYSLWVTDDNMNKVCIPLSRDGQTYSEKSELYEIDLVTVSLGRERFIQTLKQSNIVPDNFDWNTVGGYIQYTSNRQPKYLPLIFEKSALLEEMLNLQNFVRYYKGMSETEAIEKMSSYGSVDQLTAMNRLLRKFRDYILNRVQSNLEFLNDPNLPKKMGQSIYSCLNSVTYDEQIEWRNDILKQISSYINFRRLYTIDQGINTHEYICLTNKQPDPEIEKEEYDPDEDAFLTEDEKSKMYG